MNQLGHLKKTHLLVLASMRKPTGAFAGNRFEVRDFSFDLHFELDSFLCANLYFSAQHSQWASLTEAM